MIRLQDRAKSIFLDVLEIASPRERTAYLDEQCGADEALRGEVAALLDHQQRLGGFLETSGDGSLAADDAWPAVQPGTTIGPYNLLKQIGEGGMGLVYLAEQQRPLQRLVALKIIKPGMDSRQVIARFEAERQALALMDHPNIAKVLDAGTVGEEKDDGGRLQPQGEAPGSSFSLDPFFLAASRLYFVMELVEGPALTDYCDRHKLSIPARLKLFIAVCQAVQHAHQKGIIHRDLKPSNVLVVEIDGQPAPKVIDFGIAKAIGAVALGQTRFTDQGQMLGTPEYMSPEQTELGQADIDTRSDIYSLGVLLYELLTGTTPFQRQRSAPGDLAEMLREIREADPPSPSSRLTRGMAAAEKTATLRDSDPTRLRKSIRGDLDWIVLKCLEKDRARRYASAGSLADDIRRHLDGLPVEAHRPSRWYQLQKFVSRNRAAVLAVTSLAVLLVGGLIGTAAALYKVGAAARAAEAANEQRRRTLYFSDIVAAQESWNDHDLRRMEKSLRRHVPNPTEEDLRSFEWYYLWRLLDRATTDTFMLPFKARAAVYSPRGDTIAVSLHDGRVQLYDAATRRLLQSLGTELPESEHTTRVLFSGDGSKLAFQTRNQAIVHDLVTGQERQCVAPDPMVALAMSSDGRFVAGGTQKGQICVWDLSEEKETPRHTIPSAPMLNVQFLVFSHQGHRLVASGARSPMQVYDLDEPEGKLTRRTLSSESYAAAGVTAFSPDDRFLAVPTTNRKVRLFDMRDFESPGAFIHEEEIMGVAWSRDGSYLATTSDYGSLYLWDVRAEKLLWRTQAHTGSAFSVNFSPDGRTILTAGTDRALRFWPVESSGAVAHPEIYEATRFNQFTSRGTHLVSIRGFARRTLRIVEVNTWRELPLNFPGRDDVFAVAVSPQDTIAVTTRSGDLFLVHGLGESVPKLPISANISANISAQITALAFSPDGKLLALGRENGELMLWDVPGGRPLVSVGGTGRVNALRFSRDGQTLAEANHKDIVLWQPADRTHAAWREIGRRTGHWAGINTLEFHPHDDGLLASGSSDNTVKLWRWRTQSPPQTLAGHMETVYGLAFSPDGKLLASGGRDARVVLWDVATGQERARLKQEQPLMGPGLVFAPDGRTLYSGDWGKFLYVWEAASEQDVKQSGWYETAGTASSQLQSPTPPENIKP